MQPRDALDGYVTTQGSIVDRIGPATSDFFVLIAFAGGSKHVVFGRSLPLTIVEAGIHSRGYSAEVTAAEYVEMISIGMKQAAVVTEIDRCLQRTICAPIRFAPCLNLETVGVASRRRQIVELCSVLDGTHQEPQHLLAVRQMERTLISHLVDSQQHKYSGSCIGAYTRDHARSERLRSSFKRMQTGLFRLATWQP